MKTKIAIFLFVAPVSGDATAANGSHGYLIGGIVALLIMGYLIYSLIRPEKF